MLWAFPESGQDIRLPDTEQTGTSWDRQRDKVAGPSIHEKGMNRRGVKAGKGWEGEPGHGSSLVAGITASIQVMFGTYQAHACAGDS